MSFTNSGIPGPSFSYPVGVGVFTDVVASNTVFTSFVRGDGGFLSNVNSSIPGKLPNLVISNSLTVTNVFATIYQGDGANLVSLTTTSISNSGQLDITAGPYTWTYGSDGTFNLPSSDIGVSIIQTPLSAMDFTVCTQTWAFDSTGAATFPGTITADGGLLSNINSNSIVQPFVNLVVSNSLTVTNAFVDSYYASSSLVIDSTGTFYLTSCSAGLYNQSTQQVIDPNGTLYLTGASSGIQAQSGQVIDPSGTFYLTSCSSGLYNQSTQQVMDPNGTLYITEASSGIQAQSGQVIDNTGLVNSAFIYGNTLSNIQVSNVVGFMTGNVLSNLNASNLAFGVVGSSLIFGNTISNIQASNIVGLNVVYGNTLSNLNASNLAFGVVASSRLYGNTLSNINASNITFGVISSTSIYGNTISNLQFSNLTGFKSNTSSNLNASNLAFGLVQSSLILGNTLSNIQSANITQPFTNLVVSNTLTTTNVVAAGFTSNVSNTVFNYTTLSVPYINCTSINVTTTATYATVNTTNMLVTGSIGFATITGTGGTVTQLSSRNTGVTLNKPCGVITLFSSAINSQASNTFTLTNSYIASTDFVIINHVSGQTPGAYTFAVNPNAGTADITLRNVSGGTLTAGAPILQFIVIKSTNA